MNTLTDEIIDECYAEVCRGKSGQLSRDFARRIEQLVLAKSDQEKDKRIAELENRLEKTYETLQKFKKDWSNKPKLKVNNATLEAISAAISPIVNLDAVGSPLSGCITPFYPNNAASNVQNRVWQSPAPVSETPSQPKKDADAASRRKSIEDIVKNLECLERDAETSIRAFGEEWASDLATSTLGLLEEYSDTLRGLACWLAAGGFNSDGLIDPITADAKIRWGVDYLTKSSQPTLVAPPHSEQQEPDICQNCGEASPGCNSEFENDKACLFWSEEGKRYLSPQPAPQQPSQEQVIPHELHSELITLRDEFLKYQDGDLKFPWSAIKLQVIATLEAFDVALQSQPKQSTEGSEGS